MTGGVGGVKTEVERKGKVKETRTGGGVGVKAETRGGSRKVM